MCIRDRYIIGYDKNAGDDYTPLIDAIKALANGYWHQLDSTWIVNTSLSAEQIANRLVPHLNDRDELLVVKTGDDSAWWGFNDKGSQWLRNNL
ncbi:MAG: SinR family protein [Alphaproteobacteria bacterium]|nr:SinR family protein [Alphaproteobacteria bacterium]